MRRQTKPDIEEIFAEGSAFDEAANATAREAVEQHFLAGRSVSEWRNGKVVVVHPTQSRAVKRMKVRDTSSRPTSATVVRASKRSA